VVHDDAALGSAGLIGDLTDDRLNLFRSPPPLTPRRAAH